MNIGIDIDGVLANYHKFALEEGEKYCKEVGRGKLVDKDAYDTKDMFGWDEDTDFNFWSKIVFDYATNSKVLKGAAENIQKIIESGNKVFIITARWLANPKLDEKVKNAENLRIKMRETVKKWLKKNNISYDMIIFSEEDKSREIIENNIDIMIEDSPNNLKQLSKLTNMICVNWPYNENINKENIYRCYNWDEIYKKIKELEK